MINASRRDEDMSMDQILASIKRYVAEDNRPVEPAPRVANAPVGERVPPIGVSVEPQGVVQLTQMHEVPARDKPYVERLDESSGASASVLSEKTAQSARSAFERLSQAAQRKESVSAQAPSSEKLEGLVLEIAQPLVKHWLDTHLPSLVEKLVSQEIQRLVR